jgi:hypothetical protein
MQEEAVNKERQKKIKNETDLLGCCGMGGFQLGGQREGRTGGRETRRQMGVQTATSMRNR